MRYPLATRVWSFIAVMMSAPGQTQTPPGNSSDNLPRVVYQSKLTSSAPEQGPKRDPDLTDPQVTVDVFWCSGDALSSSRQLSASELAASFATVVNVHLFESAARIKTIRTRPIDIDVFLKPLDAYDVGLARRTVLLRYDHSKPDLQEIASGLRQRALTPISMSKGDAVTFSPNYLSAYVCTDIDPTAISGRLFFQIEQADQKQLALQSADQLREALPGLTVESGIEVVGNKSPRRSEVRFFFPDDKKLALRIASEISQTAKTPIATKYIAGYDDRIKPSTFEAWLTQ